MQMRILLCFSCFLLALNLACERSEVEPSPDCIGFEDSYTGFGHEPAIYIQYPSYEMPYFNPNNSDEIIFRYADGTSQEFDLIKYNWRTQVKETLYTGYFNKRPRWGKQDWILLNVLDSLGFNIYKMRSDGTNLTKLTAQNRCFSPEWNYASDQFIYRLDEVGSDIFIISDINGQPLDSVLVGPETFGSWQHPYLFANGSYLGLFIGNLTTSEYGLIYDPGALAQSLNGAEWFDEQRVIWCHTTGIYITDVFSKTTTQIRSTCNTDTYQFPSYAPEIDKVIFQRMQRIKTGVEERVGKA
ncbi:MAG: hypothetical protein KDC44_24605, partial [Phaeodactylibacter sp.]|nr:hypothetical protein [Phaeodactylibacter sp.]